MNKKWVVAHTVGLICSIITITYPRDYYWYIPLFIFVGIGHLIGICREIVLK